MRLYEVKVERYVRETTTVYVATEDDLDRVVIYPPYQDQILEKAGECDWEQDCVSSGTISRIEEIEDQFLEDAPSCQLIELIEADNE